MCVWSCGVPVPVAILLALWGSGPVVGVAFGCLSIRVVCDCWLRCIVCDFWLRSVVHYVVCLVLAPLEYLALWGSGPYE